LLVGFHEPPVRVPVKVTVDGVWQALALPGVFSNTTLT
jgi:hypothetical protein